MIQVIRSETSYLKKSWNLIINQSNIQDEIGNFFSNTQNSKQKNTNENNKDQNWHTK